MPSPETRVDPSPEGEREPGVWLTQPVGRALVPGRGDMALKHSRPLTVRALAFRWVFKAHKDSLTRYGLSPRHAHVAVQAVEGGGKVVAWLESSVFESHEVHDGDTGHKAHRARFTPGDVAKLIGLALDTGWNPMSKTQFDLPAGIEFTDYRTKTR